MSLRVYEDSGLTEIVTRESNFNNPEDESDLDGGTGETETKLLYTAMERGFLAAGMDISQDYFTLIAPRFFDSSLDVAIIGSEQILLGAGFGTKNFTGCTRAYNGTSAALHYIDDPVILCYRAFDGTIVGYDNSGSDEADWLSFCLAPAGVPDGSYNSHPAPLALGSINYDETLIINRRIIVPASTAPVSKTDLLLQVDGDLV